MKCVKDGRCIEGYVDILLDCRLAIQGSLVRLQSFVIEPWTSLLDCRPAIQ